MEHHGLCLPNPIYRIFGSRGELVKQLLFFSVAVLSPGIWVVGDIISHPLAVPHAWFQGSSHIPVVREAPWNCAVHSLHVGMWSFLGI